MTSDLDYKSVHHLSSQLGIRQHPIHFPRELHYSSSIFRIINDRMPSIACDSHKIA